MRMVMVPEQSVIFRTAKEIDVGSIKLLLDLNLTVTKVNLFNPRPDKDEVPDVLE